MRERRSISELVVETFLNTRASRQWKTEHENEKPTGVQGRQSLMWPSWRTHIYIQYITYGIWTQRLTTGSDMDIQRGERERIGEKKEMAGRIEKIKK